jgi:hypothetical protein
MSITNDGEARHLNLWKQHLGEVPEYVWSRPELETLVLADNGLQTLSPRIGTLTNLRMLDLGHNKLVSVPDAIGDLTNLTDFFYLHDNQLTDLPASLKNLIRLRYLNISASPPCPSRSASSPAWSSCEHPTITFPRCPTASARSPDCASCICETTR